MIPNTDASSAAYQDGDGTRIADDEHAALLQRFVGSARNAGVGDLARSQVLFFYYRLLPTTRRENQKEKKRTVSIQKQITKIKTRGGKKQRAQSPEALRLPTNEFRQRR